MISAAIIISTVWATVMLGLVMWAFRRHALSLEHNALYDIVAGIFWLASSMLLRGAWWDGLPFVMGREEFRAFYGGGTWPNIIFHLMIVAASLRLLRGFWLMIPDDEREDYTVLTAAFYPRRIWLKLTWKGGDE